MRHPALATLAAAALCAAAPALAQPIDEVTVTGHGPHAMSLSDTVSYADLDLNLRADRDHLLRRVSDTAERLCSELNQDPASFHNMGKSCQDVAIRGAMDQVRQAFADASANPAYANTYGTPTSAVAPDNATYGASAGDSVPIPDTAQNRARYGGPTSRAGQRTAARGN